MRVQHEVEPIPVPEVGDRLPWAGLPRVTGQQADWERLVADYEFRGGQLTVLEWVRQHRPANLRKLTLTPRPRPRFGAEAQIDFGDAQVPIAGVETTAQLFCARLALLDPRRGGCLRAPGPIAWLDSIPGVGRWAAAAGS